MVQDGHYESWDAQANEISYPQATWDRLSILSIAGRPAPAPDRAALLSWSKLPPFILCKIRPAPEESRRGAFKPHDLSAQKC